MGTFGRGKRQRVDPEDLISKAEASIRKTKEQQPRVNAISLWLNNRNLINGFGDDFEYTLRPKKAT